jgi:TolA-binding protein
MAKGKTTSRDQDQQTIEELSDRYQALNEQKIGAQANLKNAEKQLRDLRKKAKDAYGTDDLEELKKQLEKLKDENEAKRAAYQVTLDNIEAALAEVEAKHGSLDEAEDAN